jgi:hypothetical protein
VHKDGTDGVTLGKDMVANRCNIVGTRLKSGMEEEENIFSMPLPEIF